MRNKFDGSFSKTTKRSEMIESKVTRSVRLERAVFAFSIIRSAKRWEMGWNATMDFEKMNPLNEQLNLISGNLFAMMAEVS